MDQPAQTDRRASVRRRSFHWLAISLNAVALVVTVNMLGLAIVGVSVVDYLKIHSTIAIGVLFILLPPISLVALVMTRPR